MVGSHATVRGPHYFAGDMFDQFIEVHTLSHSFAQMLQACSMMFRGVFDRFPNLRVAFMEAGCSWAPYWFGRMDASKDVQFIQTGGDPETLAAFISGSIDVANLTPPTDAQAIAKGYHYVIYGPDLKIPYAATAFVTKRSVIAKRPQVIGNFMRAMAETAKLMHTDRDFVYKVLGKYLRIADRKVLDSAYNAEIKVLEPRLVIKLDSLQAIIDELAQTDAGAKKVKPQELIDNRYLDEMEKSGFFDQLWAKK